MFHRVAVGGSGARVVLGLRARAREVVGFRIIGESELADGAEQPLGKLRCCCGPADQRGHPQRAIHHHGAVLVRVEAVVLRDGTVGIGDERGLDAVVLGERPELGGGGRHDTEELDAAVAEVDLPLVELGDEGS